MKKETLIAKLEGAKELTSVVSIDLVLAALGMLEPEVRIEKVFGITQELADTIANRIEGCIDNDSYRLVDLDSACFELSYNNQIELSEANVNVHEIMCHVTACIEEFIEEEAEEEETDEVEAELMGFEGVEEILEDEYGGMRNCGDTEDEDDPIGPYPFSAPDQWGTNAGGTMDNEMS
jgi:hypothetical protein